VVAAERPRSFAFVADARGLHAERAFTLDRTPDGRGTVIVSDETQVGLLPSLGRIILVRWLRWANQVMFDDLARAAVHGVAPHPASVAPIGTRRVREPGEVHPRLS
jgi:hypothetical protein